MRNLHILLFTIQSLLISCSNSNNLDLQQYNIQKDYSLYRTEFDEYLTAHFPDSLSFIKNSCIANTNLEKNAKIPTIIKIWKTSTKKEEPETLIQVLKNKDYDRNSKNDLLRNELIQYLISRGYK